MEIIETILYYQPYILAGVVVMGVVDITNYYTISPKIDFTNRDRIIVIALWPIVIISCIIQIIFSHIKKK